MWVPTNPSGPYRYSQKWWLWKRTCIYIYIKRCLIFGVPLDTLSDFGRAISTPLPGDSISGTVGAYEKATVWPGGWPLGCWNDCTLDPCEVTMEKFPCAGVTGGCLCLISEEKMLKMLWKMIHPWSLTSRPWKMDAWKTTSRSFLVSAYFQGRTVKFPGCRCRWCRVTFREGYSYYIENFDSCCHSMPVFAFGIDAGRRIIS